MKAMVLHNICDLTIEKNPLKFEEVPIPEPGEKEVLLKVSTCGICHTELDEIEGRTPPPHFRSFRDTRSWAGWKRTDPVPRNTPSEPASGWPGSIRPADGVRFAVPEPRICARTFKPRVGM